MIFRPGDLSAVFVTLILHMQTNECRNTDALYAEAQKHAHKYVLYTSVHKNTNCTLCIQTHLLTVITHGLFCISVSHADASLDARIIQRCLQSRQGRVQCPRISTVASSPFPSPPLLPKQCHTRWGI